MVLVILVFGMAILSVLAPPFLIYFIFKRRRAGKPVVWLMLPLVIFVSFASFYIFIVLNKVYAPEGQAFIDHFHEYVEGKYAASVKADSKANAQAALGAELTEVADCAKKSKDINPIETCAAGHSDAVFDDLEREGILKDTSMLRAVRLVAVPDSTTLHPHESTSVRWYVETKNEIKDDIKAFVLKKRPAAAGGKLTMFREPEHLEFLEIGENSPYIRAAYITYDAIAGSPGKMEISPAEVEVTVITDKKTKATRVLKAVSPPVYIEVVK